MNNLNQTMYSADLVGQVLPVRRLRLLVLCAAWWRLPAATATQATASRYRGESRILKLNPDS
jgi:hypothetical protein